jgi:hypothetical protein
VGCLQDAIDRLMLRLPEECKECNDNLARSFFERVIPTLRKENSVPQWGAESSFAGQWLPAADGDGAWAVMTPSALSHGDRAPGDGAPGLRHQRRFWRVELGGRPRRRPTRRRVFPDQLFHADGGGLSVGWISC